MRHAQLFYRIKSYKMDDFDDIAIPYENVDKKSRKQILFEDFFYTKTGTLPSVSVYPK